MSQQTVSERIEKIPGCQISSKHEVRNNSEFKGLEESLGRGRLLVLNVVEIGLMWLI